MNTTRPPGRILFVSYWFPPFQAVASLRMGKFAKFLLERGWDVQVIAAGDTNPPSLALEIPKERVTHTAWTDVDRLLEDTVARLRGHGAQAPSPPTSAALTAAAPTVERKSSPWRAFARRAYQEVVRWPDNRVGWLRPALAAGDKLIANWRPDLIYATSPPTTSLIAADRLAHKHGVPWVAEFRDLWSDHPYYEYSNVRRLRGVASAARTWMAVSMFSQILGGARSVEGPSSRRSRCTVSGLSGQLAQKPAIKLPKRV